MFNAQRSDLIRRFDLNKESWLAEEVIQGFEKVITAAEEEDGIARLFPGQLLTTYRGKRVILPLLTPDVSDSLIRMGQFKAAKAIAISGAKKALNQQFPRANLDELKAIIAPRDLLPHNSRGVQCLKELKLPRYQNGSLAPPERVGAQKRSLPSEEDIWLPEEVVDSLVDYLTREEGISTKKAYAMIFRLAYLREVFCPRADRLKAGQVAWIGISTSDHRWREQKTAYRKMIPLVLTLHTMEEIKLLSKVKTIDELEHIQQGQMARILTEAYMQGGLLSLVDLQQLFLRSHSTFSRLIRRFMVEHRLILPTPGTILDAGRAMTHKDIIIDHYLDGLFSKEIAKITWHSPEAVDSYVDDFEKVMVLYTYGLPKRLLARVINRGVTLVEEYFKIIEHHFPDKDAVKSHLRRHGVEIS